MAKKRTPPSPDPTTRCDRRRCGHELRFHNPCSKCICHAFMAPMTEAEKIAAGIAETKRRD